MSDERHPRRENYGYCIFPALRRALRKTGMDRHEVAKYLGISDSNFYWWTTGGNARILLVLSKLLLLTDLTFEEAFGEIDRGEESE